MKFHHLSLRLASLLLISIFGVSAVNLPAIAGRGLPGRRVVGGTRGGPCFPDRFVDQTGQSVPIFPIALVPENLISLTTSAQPKIFWYQSTFRPDLENFKTAPKTEHVNFQLASQHSGETVYETTVPIPNGQAGIYSVTIPATIALAEGEAYNWRINPICSEDAERNIYWVGGTIQRVAATTELEGGQPGVKAVTLAKHNRWNDALTTLADAYCERPNDPNLAHSWSEMLRLLNLEANGVNPKLFQTPSIAQPRFACQ